MTKQPFGEVEVEPPIIEGYTLDGAQSAKTVELTKDKNEVTIKFNYKKDKKVDEGSTDEDTNVGA